VGNRTVKVLTVEDRVYESNVDFIRKSDDGKVSASRFTIIAGEDGRDPQAA